MNTKGSGIIGFIAIAACIAAALVLRHLFPAVGKLIFWLLGIAALGIAVLVVLVIALAFRGSRSGKDRSPQIFEISTVIIFCTPSFF